MKKYTIFAITLLAILSCAKETPSDTEPVSNSLQAVILDHSPATRTVLRDNPGLEIVSQWQAGDAIGVFGGGSANQQYTLEAGTISQDGKSAGFVSTTETPSGSLFAYSPFQQGTSGTDSRIILTFPEVQEGISSGTVNPAPDPAANILAATGSRQNGLSFRSVVSILKIGQSFTEQTTLSRVEFRDLSGAPVCGEMTISQPEAPAAQITGSGTVLTLRLGDGLQVGAGTVMPIYMFVPARDYPKGFELAFVSQDGVRTVRSVGTKMGKTLISGAVYPIGDISAYEYLPNVVCKLNSGAQVITPEKADLVKILEIGSAPLEDVDGTAIRENGYVVSRPALNLLVHDDMAPVPGQWYIFEYGGDLLPEGGVFKIKTVDPIGGGYSRVFAVTEPNVAAPYEELKLGKEMFDAEGNEIEGAGVDLDVAAYLKEIVDEEGNAVPFSVSEDGKLLFEGEAAERIAGIRTKAARSFKINLPELSVNVKQDNAEASLSAQMSVDFKVALGIVHGELQYAHFTAHPSLNLKADFSLKAEVLKWERKEHLYTLPFAPIPVAPGILLFPELAFYGTVGVAGEIRFTASVKYTYDMGTYGMSYNHGDGFTVRHKPTDPGKEEGFQPEIGGFSGSLNAYGTLTLRPYVHIVKLFGLGVESNFTLSFGIETKSLGGGTKLALTPSVELVPIVITLGGYYTKTLKQLSVSKTFDPLWERYLVPAVTSYSLGAHGHWTDDFYAWTSNDSGELTSRAFVCDDQLHYELKLEGRMLREIPYGVVVRRGSRSDLNIRSDDPKTFSWLAAGVPPYIIPTFKDVFLYTDAIPTYPVVSVQTLGVYGAEGEKEAEISETPTFHFEDGVPYQLIPVYFDAEGQCHSFNIGSTAIVCWPTDWNGNPYVKAYSGQ